METTLMSIMRDIVVESRIFIHNRSSWSCLQSVLRDTFVHHVSRHFHKGHDLGEYGNIWHEDEDIAGSLRSRSKRERKVG